MSGRFHQLVLLTAYGGAFCASAALPAGYQSCESIQVSSTGQYIDTGYKPTSATDIYAKFEVTNFNNLTSIYWTRLGASGGYVSFGFIVPQYANTSKKVRAYRLSTGSTEYFTSLQNTPSTIMELETSGATFTLNGETCTFADTARSSIDYSIYLFGLNDAGTPNTAGTAVGTKLYAFKIFENGSLVRNYVPCLATETGQAGLYDTVGNTFYPNSGSGGSFDYTLVSETEAALTVVGQPAECASPYPAYGSTNVTAGAEITATMNVSAFTNYLTGAERNLLGWTLSVTHGGEITTTDSTGKDPTRCTFTPVAGDSITLAWRWTSYAYGPDELPADYEAVEYVETTATMRKPFVNTHYVPDLEDRIVEVANFTDSAKTLTALCARYYNNTYDSRPRCVLFGIGGKWRLDFGTGSAADLASVPVDETVALAVNGGKLYQNENCLCDTFAGATGAPPGPMTLLGSYWYTDADSNRVSFVDNNASAKLYAFRVWNKNGSPKASMRPCTRKSDGRAGLYDTVRGLFCPLCELPWISVSGSPYDLGSPSCVGAESISHISGYGSNWFDFHYDSNVTASFPAGERRLTSESTYRAVGWTRRTVTAEGTDTVVTNGTDNLNSFTFSTYYGDEIYLTWLLKITIGGRPSAHVPQRYNEVEWFDFPTNTCVVTDYTPRPDRVRIEVDCLFKTNSTQGIFCARSGVQANTYTIFVQTNGVGDTSLSPRYGVQFTDAAVEAARLNGAPSLNERVTVVCATNRAWIAGREADAVTVAKYNASFTSAGGPLVFGASYASLTSEGVPSAASYNNYGSFRFYGAKVYERTKGVDFLVHRYVPCWDRMTGVTGLYDTVTERFYGVASQKLLAMGPHVSPLGLRVTVR